MTSGLHHITLITSNIQDNVDFYAGFLGLRLVKRTAGFEDASQLHLFYGDDRASPGSLVTFLAWQDGSPGRVGSGAAGEIAFAIHPASIGFWLTRALQFASKLTGPMQEFGEPVLRLTDPDGVIVKLVGVSGLGGTHPHGRPDIPVSDAIQRLHSATILSERPAETRRFLVDHLGLRPRSTEGAITRLGSDAGDCLDVRDASGFWTAAPGTGTIDHIAFRAPDRSAVETTATRLRSDGMAEINVHDRTYFFSLYVREPSGTLIELATDGPGFAVDEPQDSLGTRLFIPPHSSGAEADLRVQLPQFALPGDYRIRYRALPFVHRIHEADEPDGSTVVLLHGTGGTETSLLPLGRRLFPRALLVGLRGRSTEEGVTRFFRRFGPTDFDQADIVSEAMALEAFLGEASEAYRIDPARTIFVGYSNGANMIAAAALLHPGLIRRAILLRPMLVLEAPPSPVLDATILILSGRDDPMLDRAAALEAVLDQAGCEVRHMTLEAGHALVDEDERLIAAWLADAAP
jgi:phospholipase/carboxylesterase